MRVQDVENFYRRLEAEPDPEQVSRKSELHYLAVLAAIANGRADPDPVSLAKAVLRGVAGPAAGECQAPEVRYVQSSDQAISGDEIH